MSISGSWDNRQHLPSEYTSAAKLNPLEVKGKGDGIMQASPGIQIPSGLLVLAAVEVLAQAKKAHRECVA